MAKKSPSGTPYNPPIVKPDDIGGEDVPPDNFDQAIEVTLVNINVAVLAGVSAGDAVRILLNAAPIQVATLAGQRIGDISATDETTVRNSAKTAGRVVRVDLGSSLCVVQIEVQ